jgi:ABC-type microcin C transport system duplicated ATPase subunit YejF
MYKLSNGRILYRGRDLEEFNKGTALLDYRQSVQMVWQDPFGSLNPTHTIYHHIARPLLLHSKVSDKRDLPDMVYGLLEKVGLTPPRRPRPSTRTSSPAASASGSTSPATWRWRRKWCWRTNPPPCSTSPFASASST